MGDKVRMTCRWCGREIWVKTWQDGPKKWGMCPWCRTYGEAGETENRPLSERRKG